MRKRHKQKDGQDESKDNDVLELAGLECRKTLKQPDRKRAHRRNWIAHEASDHRSDEPLQTYEKPGIVVDGGERRDQDARCCAECGGEAECKCASSRCSYAEQTCSRPVCG